MLELISQMSPLAFGILAALLMIGAAVLMANLFDWLFNTKETEEDKDVG